MFDARLRGLGHLRLGVVGNAEARGLDHREFIGAVANRKRFFRRKLQALAATATEVLDRYQQFVAGNKLMRAIDEKEFADVAVHAPVTKALRDLRKALG